MEKVTLTRTLNLNLTLTQTLTLTLTLTLILDAADVEGVHNYRCVSVLNGHSDAVWCALPLEKGRIVSGSADGD